MAEAPLVLSLFPGLGLLDMAFEEEGFTVVRGPDLLWGGDVRRFHPPAGRFDGVIGGPPCNGESTMAHLNGRPGLSLRREFARVVRQAAPGWWVMEAVRRHDDLDLGSTTVLALSPRWIGEQQSRRRWFHSNLSLAPHLEVVPLEHPVFRHAVLAGHSSPDNEALRRRGLGSYQLEEMCELQGLPPDFHEALPFTIHGKRLVIGNGVPLPMGRAVARAVKRALALPGAHDT